VNVGTIGILGGGQLGRMLTLEAKRMGFRAITLEPLPNSPCGQVADEQIVAAYDDLRAIGELGARSDVVTYEFENIPLQAVLALERDRRIVRPSGHVLRTTQDRLLEKAFLRAHRIPTPDSAPVAAAGEIEAAETKIGLPAILKTTTGGYDGKGQWLARSTEQLRVAVAEARGGPLIYERFIPFDRELAIIAARNVAGEIVTFPVTENVHDHGVLSMTIVPARIPPERAERVREIATQIAKALEIVGAFAVEFFDCGGEVMVNEIAPRVHNSGHYSIDATQLSQYEAHIRAICDLPLVAPHLLAPAAVMVNVLGSGSGDHLDGIAEVLREPDLKLHLYGKAHAALRRKMGHFTILAQSVDSAIEIAQRARARLRWIDRREGIAV